MKSITLLLCLFLTFSLGAQDTKAPLTKSEFEVAKRKYMVMLQSADYKQMKKLGREITKKMNNLEMPLPPAEKDTDYVGYEMAWLEDKIAKTKFASKEEAKKLLEDYYALSKKTFIDNKEFFLLFPRANTDQKMEIIGQENSFDRIYELKNGN